MKGARSTRSTIGFLPIGGDVAQLGRMPLEEARRKRRLPDRDEDGRQGVAQDPRLPFEVVLDLRQARRWIKRDRNAAREQAAEEGEKELEAARQHDGDGLARCQPALGQPGRDRAGAAPQLAVGERPGLVGAPVEQGMAALGVRLDVPGERLDEGARAFGHRENATAVLARRNPAVGLDPGPRGQKRPQQIAQRLRRTQRVSRHLDREAALDPN
jgi:hypothetical protein